MKYALISDVHSKLPVNPTRLFGPALIDGTWTQYWVYWAGPLVGAVLGTLLYRYVRTTEPLKAFDGVSGTKEVRVRFSARAAGSGNRTRVLFLCTHNSARSQMAEGLLRHLAGDRFEVYSAGTEATYVRPEAIAVMAEVGVDVSGQESKMLERYLGEPFEYVITVCDGANEACPVFPSAKNQLHWSFEDPSSLATGTEEERLEVFQAVRDEIWERIEGEFIQKERRNDVRIE